MDSRTVLSRLSREDYDLIVGARKKENVTQVDVDRMKALVSRLTSVR